MKSADLSHELQRSVSNFLLRHWGIEVKQIPYIPAHLAVGLHISKSIAYQRGVLRKFGDGLPKPALKNDLPQRASGIGMFDGPILLGQLLCRRAFSNSQHGMDLEVVWNR
jgi:hypothetical protein